MTELPSLLRKLPYIFYALAVILGGWRFLNEWTIVEASYGAALTDFDNPSFNMTHSAARSAAIYWGVTEAVYVLSSGAFLHVLIAIYDKMKGPEA